MDKVVKQIVMALDEQGFDVVETKAVWTTAWLH